MVRTLPWPLLSLSPRSVAGLACLAGAIGALALPPFALWPAMVFPLSAFALLLISETAFSAFVLRAFLIGFGYFCAGLWWLGVAFLVEPDQFAWALPLGVVGLPAVLALFPLAGMVIARRLLRAKFSPWLALIIGLGLAEWLRGFLFTGFPWNSFGIAFASHLPLMQSASLVGQSGLDLLAIAIFSSVAFVFAIQRKREVAISLLVLIAMSGFGQWRLMHASDERVPEVRLRIMQPDVPLDDKFSGENAAEIMQTYLTLSTKGSYPDVSGMSGITHVIWPETAFPFLIDESPEARAQIASILPEGGALITGAVRRERDPAGQSKFFNSILVIDQKGAVLSHADKVHLVPFGEYLPLADLLEKLGIRQFVNTPGGFQAGTRRVSLKAPNLPLFSPLVCYEAIFSGEVIAENATRPEMLLNVTNDGWFGITPGPSQHFALARLRALEEGLPLVRVANNGISAVVDPYGRSVAELGLGEKGALDSGLPVSVAPPFFARNRMISPILILIVFSIGSTLKLPLRQLTRKSA